MKIHVKCSLFQALVPAPTREASLSVNSEGWASKQQMRAVSDSLQARYGLVSTCVLWPCLFVWQPFH